MKEGKTVREINPTVMRDITIRIATIVSASAMNR